MLEKTDFEKCKQFVIETAKEEFKKEPIKSRNNFAFHKTIIGNFTEPMAQYCFDNVIKEIEEFSQLVELTFQITKSALPYYISNIIQYVSEEDLKKIIAILNEGDLDKIIATVDIDVLVPILENQSVDELEKEHEKLCRNLFETFKTKSFDEIEKIIKSLDEVTRNKLLEIINEEICKTREVLETFNF